MKFSTLLAVLGLSAFTSSAAMVNFNTTGSTICDVANVCAASQTIGGLTLSFAVIGSAGVNANPTSISSFGEIRLACVDGTTTCASQDLSGYYAKIQVTQTLPIVGGSGFIGNGIISGSISGNSSGASVTWAANNSLTLGVIKYEVLNLVLGLATPSTNNTNNFSNVGSTTVQARITDTTIPEPSTYAMLGSALIGLGLLRRRKA